MARQNHFTTVHMHFNNYFLYGIRFFSLSFFDLTLSTVSTCQEQPTPIPPLTLQLEGLKLGQRALYSCPVGYSIQGISNATCLASGKHYLHLSCIHKTYKHTHFDSFNRLNL